MDENVGKKIITFVIVVIIGMVAIYGIAYANYLINAEHIDANRNNLTFPYDIAMSVLDFELMGIIVMIVGGLIIAAFLIL